MPNNSRRRILLAVEPIVVEGALAVLLSERADVVQFHHASAEERAGAYDAAIVTAGVAADVQPELLIVLPDTELGGHVAVVTTGQVSRTVNVGTNDEVFGLLAEHFAPEMPNISRKWASATAALPRERRTPL